MDIITSKEVFATREREYLDSHSEAELNETCEILTVMCSAVGMGTPGAFIPDDMKAKNRFTRFMSLYGARFHSKGYFKQQQFDEYLIWLAADPHMATNDNFLFRWWCALATHNGFFTPRAVNFVKTRAQAALGERITEPDMKDALIHLCAAITSERTQKRRLGNLCV